VKNTIVLFSIFYTCTPPWGWCNMILECGKACRRPGAPLERRREPILHACPTHHVATGGLMY